MAETFSHLHIARANLRSEQRRGPANVVSEDGTPLLSWRLRLLPYLEEGLLYRRFDQK